MTRVLPIAKDVSNHFMLTILRHKNANLKLGSTLASEEEWLRQISMC